MGADALSDILTVFTAARLVGSRATCNPAPTDTDADYLCITGNLPQVRERLEGLGFETTTDAEYEGMRSSFISFKRDDVNVIATDDGEFHRAFLAATSIAKRLNLLKKQDRVALFQAVLYRNADPAFLEEEQEMRF